MNTLSMKQAKNIFTSRKGLCPRFSQREMDRPVEVCEGCTAPFKAVVIQLLQDRLHDMEINLKDLEYWNVEYAIMTDIDGANNCAEGIEETEKDIEKLRKHIKYLSR